MSRARMRHEADASTSRQARIRGAAARNAWLAAWAAAIVVNSVAWEMHHLALHLTGQLLLAAAVALTVREITVNRRQIAGIRAGLEAATHYAFRPEGQDGAAACPMGGGPDCPQVAGSARHMAKLINGLDHSASGDSYPGR